MRRFLFFYFLSITSAAAALVNQQSSSFETIKLPVTEPEQLSILETRAAMPGLLKSLHLRAQTDTLLRQPESAKVRICETCHLSSLSQQNGYLPLLRGQNLDYLFAKIYAFKSDSKSRHPFPPYLKALSNDDIMEISLFYSTQASDLNKSWVVSELSSQKNNEQEIYRTLSSCTGCHGQDGKGKGLMPAISGQNSKYLAYRIREISAQDSKIHLNSVGPVDCRVKAIGLRESRHLASQLALVLDETSVSRGKVVYRQNCATCHDKGERGAPKLSDKSNWVKRIAQDAQGLVNNTMHGKKGMPYRGGNVYLSRHQLTEAIHFMIKQVGLHQ